MTTEAPGPSEILRPLEIDMPMRAAAIVLLCAAAAGVVSAQSRSGGSRRAETYDSATVDASGSLLIIRTGGRRVRIPKQGEQTTFDSPAVSPDKTAVGAQAMYPNGTSYDIPLQLVVYSGGRVHRFKGTGLPIFQWDFADEGRRVAYGQEPVHFGCAIHYELRDIASERLIDQIDVPEPCGENPHPAPVKVPEWVSRLASKK